MARFAQKWAPQGGKLKAASACRERGWGVGTVLRSEAWKSDREIIGFDPKETSEFISLKGAGKSERYRIMVLPADVHVVLPDVEPVVPYPEHVKLREVKDKSQVVYDFVEWLENQKGTHLACWRDGGFTLDRSTTPIETLLAEFFGIDLKKLEEEKVRMLEAQRKLNEKG